MKLTSAHRTATAPAWETHPTLCARSETQKRNYGIAALNGEAETLGRTQTGRVPALNAAAWNLGRLTPGGYLGDVEITDTLTAVAADLDIPHADIARTIRKGIRDGKASPRHPADRPADVDINSPSAAATIAAKWWGSVQHNPPVGRTAPSKLAILEGVARHCTHYGRVEVELSHREIAELSGLSLRTVTRHVADLSPWFRCTRKGNHIDGKRSCWRLILSSESGHVEMIEHTHPLGGSLGGSSCPQPEGRTSGASRIVDRTTHSTPDGHCVELLDPAHNVWHGRKNARRVYMALHVDDGMTVTAVADAVGVTRKTARNNLRILEMMSAAVCLDGLWLLGPVDSIEVETTVDHMKVRKDLHAVQRVHHRRGRHMAATLRTERQERQSQRRIGDCRAVDVLVGDRSERVAVAA